MDSLNNASGSRPRESYSPQEFAGLVGRSADRVRDWCRDRRLRARKRASGRGRYLAWEIDADELWHYINYGLRPIARSNDSGS